MYLAGILALCALLHVPAFGDVRSGSPLFALASAAATLQQNSNQEPVKPDQPAAPPAQPDQPKPDASEPPSQEARPAQHSQPPQTSNPPEPGPAPGKQESPDKKAAAPSKKHAAKKKRSSPAPGQESQTKVVHRGGAAEPTTQLAPGITGEQAAQQRQNTNQLLASTDASLQKLSGRQLTKDEQDTVTQIRKFMEQVKTADAAGDLQRAYKLAVKAHLLSDALAKP
jgi:outer membrane biosynthesis protein TonB